MPGLYFDSGISKGFEKDLQRMDSKYNAFSSGVVKGNDKIGKSFSGLATTVAATFSTAAIINFGRQSVNLYREQAKALAQVEQGLKSTGGAAGKTFDQLKKDGYKYGSQTDDARKTHSSLVPYGELPEDEKEQNRDTVRNIQEKLAVSGYIMAPARSNEPPFAFPGDFMCELAIMEHDRWMALKFTQGWQPGSETNKALKIHVDLVPWDELPESAQAKDLDFVLAIPGILAQAGYTVVKLRQPKDGS